ncbi:type II secretion system protein [Nocardioides gansuensis]|uniref:Type II secretion system protein n=1 Tax=Nocardioides gansuensis TaxID=2138300 RepID=A0A2T8F8U5_9ACTN|nr:type II secretion system F family protein [Nocardioides gansuensis]PVG82115.1 type II secretion system protein [Nocardioides gansuensis]
MSPTMFTGLALGLALGGSVLLLVTALMGWKPRAARPQRRRGEVLWGSEARRRAALAVAAALVVAVLTRWPVAAGAAAGVIYLWPTMFGGGRAAAGQIERLEALATWTESLRDSIAGSVGLEEAIRHSLHAAPPVLVPALERLDGRVRVQIPLPQALAGFAEEFKDASADLVVAALILNSRLRGPGLVATLSSLASAAREEIDMRRRIEEGRKALRRAALIIVTVTGLFAAGVAVFSRDYVAPYSSPAGQLMLALVLSVFAAGLMWIRAAANVHPPERFLVGVDQVDHALHGHPTLGRVR